MKKIYLLFVLTICSISNNAQVTVSTLASVGGNVEGICCDGAGNIYAAVKGLHQIKKITPSGSVSVIAGSGSAGNSDGNGTSASFNSPSGICVDASGNLFVVDFGNNKIRKIDPAGNVTTLAGTGVAGATDGPGASATFNSPWGICIAPNGDMFVSEHWSFKIRKVTSAGTVSTFANIGIAQGWGITCDNSSNVYLSLRNQNVILKFYPNGAQAGSYYMGVYNTSGQTNYGDTSTARLADAISICADPSGNIFIGDNPRIKVINTSRILSWVAGNGGVAVVNGPAASASFWGPSGICVGPTGDIFTTDYFGYTVRKITGYSVPAKLNENTVKSGPKFYPNPASEVVNINSNTNIKTVELSDMFGKVLLLLEENPKQINIKNLCTGVYYIKVVDSENKMSTQKIIKY